MSRSALYFILFLFAVYFSCISGKIIADIDSSGETGDPFFNSYDMSDETSVSEYLNPFAGFDLSSGSEYSGGDYQGSDDSKPYYHNSGSSGNFSRGFTFESSDSRNQRAGLPMGEGSSQISRSGYRKSSRENVVSFAPGSSNPFGGLISQLDQINKQQSSQGSGSNPTGTFGLKLGLTDNFEVLAPGTPGDLEPIPLDDGVYFLLGACMILAGFFIFRHQGQVA